MSTVKVTNLQNASSASPNIVLDSSGNATMAGSMAMATPFAMRNKIINGAMEIDQRNAGASVTPAGTGVYSLDRWNAAITQVSKFSIQQNAGSVTPPSGFKNYLGVTSLSAYSLLASDVFVIKQLIEGYNVVDLGWGTASAKGIVISFWVRSSLTGNFGLAVSWGGSPANERSYPVMYSISSANTWEYKTVAIPGDTTSATGGFETGSGTGIQLRFSLGTGTSNSGPSGSWAAANYQSATGATSVVGTNGATFYLTGVQLEVGSVATPFERRLYGTEFQLAQRYYQKHDRFIWNGYVVSGNTVSTGSYYPVQMRTGPTITPTRLGESNFPNTTSTITVNYADYFEWYRGAAIGTGMAFFADAFTMNAEL